MTVAPNRSDFSFGALFDLDGTLVDSAPDLVAAAVYALEKNAVIPANSGLAEKFSIYKYAGHGGRYLLEKIIDNLDIVKPDTNRLDLLQSDLIDYYLANIDNNTVCYEGVEQMLTELNSKGYGVGLCTNKREDMTRILLDRLGILSYFGIIIGGDTLGVPKPDPSCIHACASFFGLPECKLVMVGDSYKDMEAAQRGGAGRIAATYGYCYEDFSHYDVFTTIDSIKEAVAKIELYFASVG